MTETQQKIQFAAELLRFPNESLRAAEAVLGKESDVTKRLKMSAEWPNDPEVMEAQVALLEKYGPDYFLPTKIDLARAIYKRMEHATVTHEDYVRFAKLYAEVRGFIDKGAVGGGGVTNIQQNVLIVRNTGTDEEWEKATQEQQKQLVLDAQLTTKRLN
jgi:hypothetical protein